MSASKEKKRRQELYANGALEKKPGEAAHKAHKRKVWIGSTIGVVVLALVVAFFAAFSTGFFERHTTAATVGEHKLSAALYNFFYQDVSNSVTSSMGVSGEDLSEMPIDETGKTYGEYIREQVDKTIAQTYALNDAAKAENFRLSATDQSYVDTAADSLDMYASYYGVADGAAYLTKMYGKGSNKKTFLQYVELMQTASSYSAAHGEAISYADDEISKYYEENKASLDTVSYRLYTANVPAAEKDENGADVTDMAASKAQAEAIIAAAAAGEDAYNAKTAELVAEDQKPSYTDGSATLKSDQLISAVPTDLAGWLFDANRKYGDTTVLAAGESGYYAVYFVDNSAKYDVEMVNVRHILYKSEKADDEASKAAAKAKADEMLAKFQAGEQSEDAFAALATEFSQDDGTKLNGGLMKDMRPGQSVAEFNDWSFDPARKPGDAAVVETTYGAHVIYFAGNAGNYQQYRVITAMRTRDTNAWAEELGTPYTVTTKPSGMKLVKK